MTNYSDYPPPPPPPPPASPYQGPQAPLTPADEKMWAILTHIGGIFFGFIPALIVFLVAGNRGPFLRHHATEALNFQLTLLIVYVVSVPLLFVLIGFLTMIAAGIGCLVFSILAAIQANNGQWYRYPLTIRMVK